MTFAPRRHLQAAPRTLMLALLALSATPQEAPVTLSNDTTTGQCYISTHSIDGFGHQLHMAIMAFATAHAVPNVEYWDTPDLRVFGHEPQHKHEALRAVFRDVLPHAQLTRAQLQHHKPVRGCTCQPSDCPWPEGGVLRCGSATMPYLGLACAAHIKEVQATMNLAPLQLPSTPGLHRIVAHVRRGDAAQRHLSERYFERVIRFAVDEAFKQGAEEVNVTVLTNGGLSSMDVGRPYRVVEGGDLLDSFKLMVNAEHLILSPSSLSRAAQLLSSKGTFYSVWYMPFGEDHGDGHYCLHDGFYFHACGPEYALVEDVPAQTEKDHHHMRNYPEWSKDGTLETMSCRHLNGTDMAPQASADASPGDVEEAGRRGRARRG